MKLTAASSPYEPWVGVGVEHVVDSDIHIQPPPQDVLSTFMTHEWREWFATRGWGGPSSIDMSYPPNAPSTRAVRWRNRVPGESELRTLQTQLLDASPVDIAIANCYFGLDSVRNPHAARVLARAVNDWLLSEWLAEDPRLVASMVVPARDPIGAATEVNRIGSSPGIVQVLLPVRADRLYGDPSWWPLYEAVAANDLVLGLHFGGTAEGAPSSTGYASYYVEQYASEWQNFGAHTISLIAQGVFKEFSSLRVTLLESGFTWLPSWLWRMDADWKGTRSEVPWVDRLPSEFFKDFFRVATAPIDATDEVELRQIVDWLDCQELLLYASDYPHEHLDDLSVLIRAMDERLWPRVAGDNAREWYRLS